MPFLLGFLFLAAVYGLLFTVSRLEKKRKPQLKTHRVQAGFRPQQQAKPPSRKNVAKVKKSGSKQTGATFHNAEVKASGHGRKLKTALEELEQHDQRLRELETDIWVKELGSPSPKPKPDLKQSTQRSNDDWKKQDQKVIEDNWQRPSQEREAADRISESIQRREQEKQDRKELARSENELAQKARQQFKETQRQQELEANQQRQIQHAKEQELQQEIEADRQRLRQEKQEAARQIEADRIRLRREKEVTDRQLEQDLEAARQRLRNTPQHSTTSDRAKSKNLKQSRQVTHKIKSKLEKLCGNDYRLAQRLVDGIRLDHPDRTEQWCWEKAIWDMERDRHY
jgi:DNA polymerase III alpha subunit (gram-positive type)